MVRSARHDSRSAKQAKNTNVKFAQKLAKSILEFFRQVLLSLGRPFYLLFALTIVLTLFTTNWVGKIFIDTTKNSLGSWAGFLKNLKPKKERVFKKHRFSKKAEVIRRIVFETLTKVLHPKLFIQTLQKFWTFFPGSKQSRQQTILRKQNLWSFRLLILKLYLKLINLGSKIKFSSFRLRLTKAGSMLIIFLLLLGLFGFVFWHKIIKDLPDAKLLANYSSDVSTKIYDRNGVLLYKIYKDENRTPVALNDIPRHVQLATIAAEDAEFYSHNGFSIRGITRSILRNIEKGELGGGSTITQQLVKNTLLTPEKTLSRKIKELILSVQVEKTFSKDEILEMYLNEVSYGGTAYGIEEASLVYFGKNVGQINLSEAALLAGLPKSPSRYSPFNDPASSINRQKEVLNLMMINKFITEDLENSALAQKVTFAQNKIDIKAPHFVMYVKSLLAEKYGEDVLEKGGLEVVTTLDYELQKAAEQIVLEEVEKLKGLRVGNGAAVVLNPKTGEVLAMVGSKDYFDTEADGNVNVTIRPRQPGSSIKLVNYAYALSHGFTPATIINDAPVSFSLPGQPTYSPKNYDGNFRGNLTLRSALAESRNVPAVKILASYGVGKMIELGQLMGITTWGDTSRFGLSLTLGGGEVKLLDLAQVYATVANYGKRPNVNPILSVRNFNGKLLGLNGCAPTSLVEQYISSEAHASETSVGNCPQTQILDSRVSFMLTDILKDNNARAPAFGRSSLLVVSNHPEVAVKTGTSNDLKDNLAVGYSQDVLVAVWVGNNDNSPMSRVASGITGASPIWNKIMSFALKDKESLSWARPEGIEQIAVCSLTATLPCEGCPTRSELFLSENKPTRACLTQAIEERQDKEERRIQGRLSDPAARFP